MYFYLCTYVGTYIYVFIFLVNLHKIEANLLYTQRNRTSRILMIMQKYKQHAHDDDDGQKEFH